MSHLDSGSDAVKSRGNAKQLLQSLVISENTDLLVVGQLPNRILPEPPRPIQERAVLHA